MKNAKKHTTGTKKKKSDEQKSYLICYYHETSSTFTDKVWHEIKNIVIEARSKKEAYKIWTESRVVSSPSVLNIILLDDD